MKKNRSVALVCAGPVNRGTLAKLPGLTEVLGPVKASTYRVASRTANTLRCGWAVKTYDELSEARVLLLSAPDSQLPSIVRDLDETRLVWKRRTVVLLDSALDCSCLEALRLRGAAVAAINVVQVDGKLRLVIEGDSNSLKTVKSMFNSPGSRLMELGPGGKPYFQAGTALCGTMAVPLLKASMTCLRASGLNPSDAAELALSAVSECLRTLSKGGNKTWEPLALAQESLTRLDPATLEFCRAILHDSARYIDSQKVRRQGA